MKKHYFFITLLFLGVFAGVMALDNEKLLGTWDVTIQETPQGNVNVHLIIEKADGKMKAKFKPAGSEKETNVTVTEQENGITLYFFAEGYDLHMTVKPDGNDGVTGYLVDQFPVKGTRVKK